MQASGNTPRPRTVNDVIELLQIKNLTQFVKEKTYLTGSPRSDLHLAVLFDELGNRKVPVVVKYIRGQHFDGPEADKALERLFREIAASARANHRNVTSCLGIVQEASGTSRATPTFGIVSWYVEHALLSYVKANLAETLRVAREVADALRYLHSEGIVHGDLKHDNVRVTASGIPQIIDFGLAVISDITGFTTDYWANPQFTAPEMFPLDWEGGEGAVLKPTMQSDVFSLGILLYQILDPECEFPYGRLQRNQGLMLVLRVQRGRRPERRQRHFCDRLWHLMCDCWDGDLARRPPVVAVLARLQQI